MVDRQSLSDRIDCTFEWLAVGENGASFPLRRDEIQIEATGTRVLLSYPGLRGYRTLRVLAIKDDGAELTICVAGEFGRNRETLRLIPREPAAELAANIEFARLERANEIAKIIAETFAGARVSRVSLSKRNGRIAHFNFASADGQFAAIADVTATLSHEVLLAAALDWLKLLRLRKKNPIDQVLIAAEKRQARNLQKLHGTLKAGARNGIGVLQLNNNGDAPKAVSLSSLTLSDLWREKPKKLKLPAKVELSETAGGLIAHAPDKIDVIFSGRGETLRFRGLPFARVRRLMGREHAWFGLARDRKPLNDETRDAYHDLLDKLHRYRDPDPPEKRHELFRLASEAWLESILRRNIKLLDPNLILSPIYNQFRTAADKIDLLAIRSDGRLVIIELKTSPDREMIFQAADYWRKIELQRRKGVLAAADLFNGMKIADEPTLVYAVAPALSFHRQFEEHARLLSPDLELWRWELHENWRSEVKVIARRRFEP
jgi:hypothetical protein